MLGGLYGRGKWSSNIWLFRFLKDWSFGFLKLHTGGRVMMVYDASTRILAEFGGIRDLSRHLSLKLKQPFNLKQPLN